MTVFLVTRRTTGFNHTVCDSVKVAEQWVAQAEEQDPSSVGDWDITSQEVEA